MTTEHACRDCRPDPPSRARPAPHPGPRCATHWRAEKARRKAAAHERRVRQVYGLGEGEYAALYELQGGACAICRRARGLSKRLAVDHDHVTGEPRGLLCGPDNQLLGHARDNPDFFIRAIAYLTNPPYQQLKNRNVDGVPPVQQGDEADGGGQVSTA